MLPSLSPALDHLHLLYPLLYAADPGLCGHISRTQPFFALAATLTLYAHDIQEYSDIARLFDVLLAMDPIFPVYLFAEVRHSPCFGNTNRTFFLLTNILDCFAKERRIV